MVWSHEKWPFAGVTISVMISYAISLHFAWAIFLLIDVAATNATALNALYRYIHPTSTLFWVLVWASGSAAVGMGMRRAWLILLLLLPQQVLLMMSASGAIEAIWLSKFADGIVRSRAFIATDQFYSILAAIGHTVAIIIHAARSR